MRKTLVRFFTIADDEEEEFFLPAAAILGCSSVAQLEDSMTAADLQLGTREAAELAGE